MYALVHIPVVINAASGKLKTTTRLADNKKTRTPLNDGRTFD